MDSIVSQVIEILKRRKQQSKDLTYQNSAISPDKQIFITNGNINLRNVSIQLVSELYALRRDNDWIDWILYGIDFETKFNFYIGSQTLNFIPMKMITDWPVNFIVNQSSPVFAFYHSLITRRDIAAIPDQSTVVVTSQQRLTEEAQEISVLKNLKFHVRTDENCIWQR
ncbi:PduM family microcompartment protein [Pediococcus claussenii]|uniref:Propanediol utilization protein PduM n=1 Tax=Pediococcus claussenii (strain ATCC BAA-344 / DSM 14800 / JCM 18046 / KCTC 3811 / LMG 21948 / P06) TaxID=701521 RepID=G8PEJ1_PEDCP|nr:PduM family microcompartment protein [Pediococcus claussenii]AEV95600.1 Propanediol utilization protein PduM [Pediococcus claussenii ATCC BAA-344]ANZ69121.1 microcompartment protein PduM [Pediococcus claussenii]ANZ70938.1 microcompartment protein PduM [Pediococcus claussenii]KRN20167.1 pduM protein [Pediococcus claussenii]